MEGGGASPYLNDRSVKLEEATGTELLSRSVMWSLAPCHTVPQVRAFFDSTPRKLRCEFTVVGLLPQAPGVLVLARQGSAGPFLGSRTSRFVSYS